MRLVLWLLVACAVAGAPRTLAAAGQTFYVSPSGSSVNNGSQSSPLDLATALSPSGPVRAGDTVWLRGGTYYGNFTSDLTGTASAPILVRQYPGERATLDGSPSPTLDTLVVRGAWTTYWGFEITNSAPNRQVDISGRGTGLNIYGPNTKFINLVVHDAQVGIGFWTPAVNAELYGNIVYNNGIEWSDRGHGHSIYAQNQTGTKRIVDNILFNSFSFGIHAYTQGGAIDNFVMDGNVAFNHGVLSAVSGAKSNLLLGGGQVAHNASITNNHFYYTPGYGGRGAEIGYGTPCANATVTGNYFVAATAVALNCTATTYTGNTHDGSVASGTVSAYPNNTYNWSHPSESVFVRPNQYEPGRANVVIYNWSKKSQVAVDLSKAGLASGDTFEIRDAQNFYGPAVLTGTYSGAAVMVPMTGMNVAQPVGNAPRMAVHTAPDFGVFVVLRRSGGSTAPTATLSVSPASVSAGQSATLSWTSASATSVSINQGIGAVAASGSRTVTPSATTTYTLTATGSGGTVTRTATVTVNATQPPPSSGSATAAFVRTDATTQGNWKGVYGSDGYSLAASSPLLPAYAQLSVTAQSWLWNGSTTDVRALQSAGTGPRVASTWYEPSTVTMDVNLTDGNPHQIAVYGLDWDQQSRAQTIDVLDAATGALLDRQNVSGYGGGRYWVWTVSGRVRLRFTRVAGPNAVVAGVFFDKTGGATPGTPSAPTATLTASPTSLTAGQSSTLSWSSTGATTVTIDNGIGSVAASGSRTVSPATTTTYTLTASNAGGNVTRAVTVTVAGTQPPPSGGTSAAFIAADSTTKGNWKGVYGSAGASIAPASVSLPAYASLSVRGQSWLWDSATADIRAPQAIASGAPRAAGTWYDASVLNLDLQLKDGAAHLVALYGVDWDQLGRTQTIEVIDTATGAVLDRQSSGSFTGGRSWQWRISGRVTFRITRTAGPNASISALFVD